MKHSIPTNFVLAGVLVILAGCSLSPKPLDGDQVTEIARQDRELIFEDQEAIDGELTMELAMSLALKYNLENRVRLMEETVAIQQLDMTKTELLPSLAASAGYLDRDNINASRSVSVKSGLESLEPSTSQDTQKYNTNARFAWNLLDFGVSYLQAKQDADRFLIAQKARQKIMLTLLKEVRAAYWKAVAMEQMRSELDVITANVEELLDHWQSVREERLRPPVAVLMDIRALVETRQQLDEIRRTIDTASARLANLINAQDYRKLKLPLDQPFPGLLEVSEDVEALELVALSNSADYASEIYKVRIDQLESRKAMMRLLPGLEFSYSENYDDNSFLLNQRWGELGLNLTGDLTQLMFVKRIKKFRESNEQLTISRKLTINMAIITGVHITWQDYQNSVTQLERAQYLQEIDEQISLLTRNAEVNLKESGAIAIQTELRAFRSKISRMQSYADAQEAFGELAVSLGVNPIPVDYEDRSVRDLAEEVAIRFDAAIFPYTREGEMLMAERRKVDEWIEQRRLASEAELQLAREQAIAEQQLAASQELLLEQSLLEQSLHEEPVVEEVIEAEEEPLLAKEVVDESIPASEESPVLEEALATTAVDEPVQLVADVPLLNEYLTYFWVKYFTRPNLDTYLQEFRDNLPDGPSRESYLKLFLDNLPDGPSRENYLKLFLDNLPDGPSRQEYLDLFLKNLPDAPNKDEYLKLFLENLPEGPDRESYIQLFLEKLKSSPHTSLYLDEFRAIIEASAGE